VLAPTLLIAIDTGETSWLTPTDEGSVTARGPGEYLLIALKQAEPMRDFLGQPFDFVITVCDKLTEACPVFPGDSTSSRPCLDHFSCARPASGWNLSA
jgi:hypothetical protein